MAMAMLTPLISDEVARLAATARRVATMEATSMTHSDGLLRDPHDFVKMFLLLEGVEHECFAG
jgi:hypothetical protein